MFAQIVSVMFWISIILLFANQESRSWHMNTSRNRENSNNKNESNMVPLINDTAEIESARRNMKNNSTFEASHPLGSEVVVSVRGLRHEYFPEFVYDDILEKKTAKPVEALQDLSLNIYRNEVFVYFGHYGAGSKYRQCRHKRCNLTRILPIFLVL